MGIFSADATSCRCGTELQEDLLRLSDCPSGNRGNSILPPPAQKLVHSLLLPNGPGALPLQGGILCPLPPPRSPGCRATATNENRCSLIMYSDSVGYLFDVRSMISRHILLLWYGHFQNPALSSSLFVVPSAFRLQNHSPETLSTMCSLMNL